MSRKAPLYLSHTNRLLLMGSVGFGVYGAQVLAPEQWYLVLPGGFLMGAVVVLLRARHLETTVREGMGAAFGVALLIYLVGLVFNAADSPSWLAPVAVIGGFALGGFLPSRKMDRTSDSR